MPGLNQSSAYGGCIPFKTINDAALRASRSLLQQIIPGGKFRSLEYIVRNPRRDDQHAGSFKINYRTGVWKDFATGDGGGDLISLVAFVRGSTQGDAARELATMVGGWDHHPKDSGIDRSSAACGASLTPKVCSWGDAGPPIERSEIRRHIFKNSNGVPVRVKIKYRGKYTNWYRILDENGNVLGWQPKKPDDFSPIPYMTVALNPFDDELRNDEILWPEGEKDVETLATYNLPAFTFGGVGDGLPDGIEVYLTGRRIAILADNDKPGREHAEKKASLAHAVGATSVKIVQFPDLPSKGDVSDFFESGGTVKQLHERIDAVPLWKPETQSESQPHSELVIRAASDIKPQPIDWLWEKRIAKGKLTLIAGDPGLGKSQLTAFIAATVSTGGRWPCQEGQTSPGSVVIFSAEDDAADTIVPRLLAADADVHRVHIVEAVRISGGTENASRRMFHLQNDLSHLESTLTKLGDVRLVIIDPITAYLGGVDTHRNSDVRGVLGLVAEMAARHQVAVVAVSHWNKSGSGTAVNRVTGSGAFTAAVRAAFMVAKDPDDGFRRLFIPMKNNLARIDGGLAFRLEQRLVGDNNAIVASAIVWDSERVTRTADEVLAAADEAAHPQSATDDAVDWLVDLLADGSLPSTQVRSEADAAGHSWATIKRAKNVAGVKAFREGGIAEKGQWLWRLRTQEETLSGSKNRYLAQETNVSTLGEVEHLSSGNGDGDPSVMARTTPDRGATNGGHL
jgi:AAA domain-containing protein